MKVCRTSFLVLLLLCAAGIREINAQIKATGSGGGGLLDGSFQQQQQQHAQAATATSMGMDGLGLDSTVNSNSMGEAAQTHGIANNDKAGKEKATSQVNNNNNNSVREDMLNMKESISDEATEDGQAPEVDMENCVDVHRNCDNLADNGNCEQWPGMMVTLCPVTCNACHLRDREERYVKIEIDVDIAI